MEHTYKLICLDLDGTLLNEKKQVTKPTVELLLKLKEQGMKIALLSGRMPLAIEMIEKQMGFSCIKAASAGTYILQDGECIGVTMFEPEIILEIYEKYAKKYDIPLWIYQGKEWFVTKVDEVVEYETGLIQYAPKIIDVEKMMAEWKESKVSPNKVLFGTSAEIIEKIKAEMDQDPSFSERVDYAKSSDVYLEVFPKGADKGSASLTICEVMGIDPKEMIAIGDQELDIPMLQVAGLAIAMENAPDHVKEYADFVTKSNEEDGVAYALQKYLEVL